MNDSARYRLSVASRVLAAAVGGYALTSALAILMALLLPTGRAQAVMLASDIGFLVYVSILLWAFHTPTAKRAWGWLLFWTGTVALFSWWLLQGGAA